MSLIVQEVCYMAWNWKHAWVTSHLLPTRPPKLNFHNWFDQKMKRFKSAQLFLVSRYSLGWASGLSSVNQISTYPVYPSKVGALWAGQALHVTCSLVEMCTIPSSLHQISTSQVDPISRADMCGRAGIPLSKIHSVGSASGWPTAFIKQDLQSLEVRWRHGNWLKGWRMGHR